jgi:hypothetical protein
VKYRYVKVCDKIHHEFIDNEDGDPEIVHVRFVGEPDRNVVVVDGETYSARDWWLDQEREWQELVEQMAECWKAGI